MSQSSDRAWPMRRASVRAGLALLGVAAWLASCGTVGFAEAGPPTACRAQVIEQVREDLALRPLVGGEEAEDLLVPAGASAEDLGSESTASVDERREVREGRPGSARQHLVGEREGVPHAAARPSGELARDTVLSLDALCSEHLVEACGDALLAEQGQLRGPDSARGSCRARGGARWWRRGT